MDNEEIVTKFGRTYKRDVRKTTLSYKGYSREIDLPGWYAINPLGDELDAYLTSEDTKVSNAALLDMKRQYAEEHPH